MTMAKVIENKKDKRVVIETKAAKVVIWMDDIRWPKKNLSEDYWGTIISFRAKRGYKTYKRETGTGRNKIETIEILKKEKC